MSRTAAATAAARTPTVFAASIARSRVSRVNRHVSAHAGQCHRDRARRAARSEHRRAQAVAVERRPPISGCMNPATSLFPPIHRSPSTAIVLMAPARRATADHLVDAIEQRHFERNRDAGAFQAEARGRTSRSRRRRRPAAADTRRRPTWPRTPRCACRETPSDRSAIRRGHRARWPRPTDRKRYTFSIASGVICPTPSSEPP